MIDDNKPSDAFRAALHAVSITKGIEDPHELSAIHLPLDFIKKIALALKRELDCENKLH